jgi:hypothetical protein
MHLGGKRMIVQMREDAVRIVQVEEVDEPNGRMPPPIWVVVVVVLAVVGWGWLLIVPPDAAESTPTVTPPDTVPESRRYPSPSSKVAIPAPGFGPGDLAGDVAVTSPLPFSVPGSLWVLRPSGQIVRLPDISIWGGSSKYPLLMTSERIAFASFGHGYLLDADAVASAESLAPATFVVPGANEGLVWFVRSRSLLGDVSWVAPVDVDTRTVGPELNIADLFSGVVVGVADGLIVNPKDQDAYGEFAYWSPSAGLATLDIDDPDRETVISASGDLAIVATSNRVSVFNTRNGEYVMSYSHNLGGTVSSACLSPDTEHLVVVGSDGEAFVGNVLTGQVFALDGHVQESNGVGWTSVDQLVYLAVSDDGRTVVVHNSDESSGEIAHLEGAGDWWLAASGTMC